jgi:glycosyltransferase involved in cell wall biosynthesis
LIPFLRPDINVIDVIHNLEPGHEMRYGELFDSISDRLDKVVCVDNATQKLITSFSKREVVEVISNPTDVEFFKNFRLRKYFNRKCVFVGRDDIVKRVHIVKELAKKTTYNIGLIGEIKKNIELENLMYHGLVNSRKELSELLNRYDILLLTSSTEGFPMVIQESMAQGLICISTDVGGISQHIKNGENGFLIDEVENESVINNEITYRLSNLENNPSEVESISMKANEYARKHFGYIAFKDKILKLLE